LRQHWLDIPSSPIVGADLVREVPKHNTRIHVSVSATTRNLPLWRNSPHTGNDMSWHSQLMRWKMSRHEDIIAATSRSLSTVSGLTDTSCSHGNGEMTSHARTLSRISRANLLKHVSESPRGRVRRGALNLSALRSLACTKETLYCFDSRCDQHGELETQSSVSPYSRQYVPTLLSLHPTALCRGTRRPG